MKVLFALSSPEYLRYYDETIAGLAERGHEVVIAVGTLRERKFVRLDSMAPSPLITVAGVVPARDDRWTRLASGVRGTMDFARYLHPELADAAVLRARMKRQALPRALQALDRIRVMGRAGLAWLMRALAAMERAIPVAEPVARFLEEHAPDVVLVSPLIEAASEQVELVKAARARGIPVAAAIASWDNLTNKGDLRAATDAVIVWNEAQRREAVELHRVPARRVAVTGAQPFDRWFDRRPSREREAFAAMVGLPADKPFVLFVGSSIFIARAEHEVPFVRRWIEAIRSSSHPAVRDLAILLRPHPYSGPAWAEADWSDLRDVAVWPRARYNPVDEDNRADFFDSLFHSEAVVGINTSAMIEAAIVGRPVFSVLAEEFAGTQEGTRHFRHLLPEHGGFLRVATTLDEHVDQLTSVRGNPDAIRAELRRFVASFVRPHGLDRACTPILIETIEHLAESRPAPARDGLGVAAVRAALVPLAAIANRWPAEASSKPAARPRKPAKGLVPSILIAATAPLVAATLLVLGFAAAELAGRAPLAYERPRNIAEAAGMGLASEVVRFQRLGQDPRHVFPVRTEIISSEVTRATALEAAVWSRRLQLVQLLDRQGLLADAGTRAHLACLADDIKAVHIHQYLAAESAACTPGASLAQVEARSE